MTKSNVFIGSDHRGFTLKKHVLTWLNEHSYIVHDVGTHVMERCDASDFAEKLVQKLKTEKTAYGVLICGTGQAMAMTANRYKNIRAALCCNTTLARQAREHNDANVLVLGADITGEILALECLNVFLHTKFLGGRYADRVEKLSALGGIEI